LVGSILTDKDGLGVKTSPKVIWNLHIIGSMLYQIYSTLAMKLCPAADPENDQEFLKQDKATDDEDDDDEGRTHYEIKYLGDPVSKLVYNKNDLWYFYSKHYETGTLGFLNSNSNRKKLNSYSVQGLVQLMMQVFEKIEKFIRSDKSRLYKRKNFL